MDLFRFAPMLLLAFAPPSSAASMDDDKPQGASGTVTIYRCADAKGRLVALRDSPCLAGEQQQTVQMQRPQDAPPRAASTAPASTPVAADASPREIRIVAVQPPQPMYECTAPDGTLYTSDSGEGNPRWVPTWAFGHPVWPRPPHAWPPQPRPPREPPLQGHRPGGTPGGIAPPPPGPRPPPTHPYPPVAVATGGTWARDPCVRLPQQEICRRLSDRRFEILRIYHAAMPSGRAELDREQARIDARLANDCSAR